MSRGGAEARGPAQPGAHGVKKFLGQNLRRKTEQIRGLPSQGVSGRPAPCRSSGYASGYEKERANLSLIGVQPGRTSTVPPSQVTVSRRLRVRAQRAAPLAWLAVAAPRGSPGGTPVAGSSAGQGGTAGGFGGTGGACAIGYRGGRRTLVSGGWFLRTLVFRTCPWAP
jgi:hypothetical protein